MAISGKTKITVSIASRIRLDAHMIRMRKKYPGWPGRVTRDDAIAGLLDEEENRA